MSLRPVTLSNAFASFLTWAGNQTKLLCIVLQNIFIVICLMCMYRRGKLEHIMHYATMFCMYSYAF